MQFDCGKLNFLKTHYYARSRFVFLVTSPPTKQKRMVLPIEIGGFSFFRLRFYQHWYQCNEIQKVKKSTLTHKIYVQFLNDNKNLNFIH